MFINIFKGLRENKIIKNEQIGESYREMEITKKNQVKILELKI